MRRMRLVRQLVVVGATCVLACGRVGFDVTGGAGGVDAAGDGGVLDDGGLPCLAPDTSFFSDDFADGALSAWAMPVESGGGVVDEIGGVLVARDSTNSSTAYWGSQNLDMRGHHTIVEVLAVPPVASGAQALMYWWAATDRIGVVIRSGTVEVLIGNQAQPVGTPTYDAVAHRWLRILETGGTSRVEASSDGRTFVMLAEAPTPDSAAAMQFLIGIQLVGGDQSVQEAKFDNLNLPPACP